MHMPSSDPSHALKMFTGQLGGSGHRHSMAVRVLPEEEGLRMDTPSGSGIQETHVLALPLESHEKFPKLICFSSLSFFISSGASTAHSTEQRSGTQGMEHGVWSSGGLPATAAQPVWHLS